MPNLSFNFALFVKIILAKRSCFCEVLEGYREPCGENGGDLDQLTCHKYGCCYIEPLSEDAPRCFLKKSLYLKVTFLLLIKCYKKTFFLKSIFV